MQICSCSSFQCNFDQCKLTGSSFEAASLFAIKIIEGDWSYVNLSDCDLKAVDLRKVRLVEADLYGADLEKADLRQADLARAVLAKANLFGADFRGANMEGIDFLNTNLRGAKIDLAQAVLFAEAHGIQVD